MKKILIILLALTLLGCGATGMATVNTNYDSFAKCLTEKGVTMYGAFWCSHCQDQKKMFGDSVQYIKYVECTQDPCEDIKGYPTWKFPNGQRIEGTATFEEISKESGCAI